MSTHVPCFPVKPWNSTFVSPLMRRFLIVSAYCEEPVAYCLVADLVSAERRGFRRACIVAIKLSRRQSYVYGRVSRVGVVGGAGFERAGSCDTHGGSSSAAAWPQSQNLTPRVPSAHETSTTIPHYSCVCVTTTEESRDAAE
jgi:hypothetical protein